MKASLTNYRQSPRKVRLVASLIRGKSVAVADRELAFLVKRASSPIRVLLASAVANAKQAGIEAENLFVKEIRVDKGIVMKRQMPRAFGRASRINKRASHVLIVLGERGVETKKIEVSKNPPAGGSKKTAKPAAKAVTKKISKPRAKKTVKSHE